MVRMSTFTAARSRKTSRSSSVVSPIPTITPVFETIPGANVFTFSSSFNVRSYRAPERTARYRRHRFGVVVEDLRVRVEDDLQCIFSSLKVGNQNFDLASGSLVTNLADCLGEDYRRAEVVVIPIHAGDYGVL